MWIFITIVITYFIVTLFGYVGHWSLHKPWMRKFNEIHLIHHLKLYPASDYLSDSYRSAGTDNTLKVFAIMSIPILIIPIILWAIGVIPLYLMLLILMEMLIIGWLHDYLHDSFHIRNHFLTRMPLLKTLFNNGVKLHYEHHLDLNKNYGIFSFHWDKLFNTLKK